VIGMSFAKRFKKNPRRNSPPRPRRGGTQSGRRKLQFEQLEPRLLLNAHPLALVAAAARDLSVQIVDDHGTPTIQIVDQHAVNPGSRVLASQALADTSSVLIQGSDQNDSLTIDASVVAMGLPIDFIGGGGSDTLVGPGVDSSWNVKGAKARTLGSVTFSGVENLIGAAGNKDTFVFTPGGSLGGIVDGGAGGFDTIVLDGGTYSRVVYRGTGPNSGTIQRDTDLISYAGVEPITDNGSATTEVVIVDGGNSNNDQIVISDSSGKLHIESTNGLFESIDITSAPSISLEIQSGGGDDTFEFQGAPAAFNTILKFTGDGGTDTVVTSQDADMTLTDSTLSFSSVSIALSGINRAHLTLSTSTGHTIDASGFSGRATLTGNTGADTLIGGSGDDVLTGGGGDDTLTGGAGDDRYVFDAAWGKDTLNESGGLGGGNDILDFSSILDIDTHPITVSSNRDTISRKFGSSELDQGSTTATQAEQIDVTLPFTGSSLRQKLTDAFDALKQLIDRAQTDASAFTQLTNSLPLLSALTGGTVPNLGNLLDLTHTFDDLKAAVFGKLNGLADNPKLSDIVALLNALTLPSLFTGGGNSLTFTTNYRGADDGTDELEALIDVAVDGSVDRSIPIDLGANAATKGLNLAGSVDLMATATGTIGFGLTTTGTLIPFLVPDSTLTLEVDGDAKLNSASLNLGVLSVQVGSGEIEYDGTFGLQFNDPNNNDARITTGELGSSLSDLFSVTSNSTFPFHPPITVTVDSGVKVGGIFNGADLGGANVTVNVSHPGSVFGSGSDVGQYDISFTATLGGNFISLDDFENVSTTDLLGMLGQVLDALSGLGKSQVLRASIPFTGKTVGDVVDIANGFKTSVLDPLFKSGDILHPDANGDGAVDFNDLYFKGIQSLAQAITAELGLNNLLDINYDATAKELTFALNYNQAVGHAIVVETTRGKQDPSGVNEVPLATRSFGMVSV